MASRNVEAGKQDVRRAAAQEVVGTATPSYIIRYRPFSSSLDVAPASKITDIAEEYGWGTLEDAESIAIELVANGRALSRDVRIYGDTGSILAVRADRPIQEKSRF